MLLVISHHVQDAFPLLVRGVTLYLYAWKMQQLLTKLIHTVHVNKASAWRNKRPNFGNIESFLFSLFFCPPPPKAPPPILFAPLNRDNFCLTQK